MPGKLPFAGGCPVPDSKREAFWVLAGAALGGALATYFFSTRKSGESAVRSPGADAATLSPNRVVTLESPDGKIKDALVIDEHVGNASTQTPDIS